MSNSKTTKRALLGSAVSMLLCVSMLIGSTFAWFTDTATSSGNKIVAGNLDVKLRMYDAAKEEYVDISENKSPIFGSGSIAQNNNAETLWEPGKTQVAYLAIENNGNLDLKYKVAINVENVKNDLYEVMEYVITPDAKASSVTAWDGTGAKSVVVGSNITAEDVTLEEGATHYFALSVHMKDDAGNDYQDGQVNFDLTVYAAQLASESDSFGNGYDNKAIYDEEVQKEAQPWHQLDAVHNDTVVDGGGNTYAAEYQEVCLAGNADITIKGVTFQNGLTIYTPDSVKGTVTLEKCTIYLNNGNGNPSNASISQHKADYGLYIGAVSENVTYVFKNCTFTAYDNHTYTNTDDGYNVYIGGNNSADSITFEGCTFEKSSKHGIGCPFAYETDSSNPNTYYNLTVKGCNFIDWNNGNYDGAAIRGNVPADVLTTYNKSINISGNTFGNSNGSAKANVAITDWNGEWS